MMSDPIKAAIDQALTRHGTVAGALSANLDPTSIAIGCAKAAQDCDPSQAVIAARLLLAADAIRRLQFAEVAAQINHDTIMEMRK